MKQVEAVTASTKEIEAKIDNQVWSGQRQWELKRDALLATVSALRRAHNARPDSVSRYNVDMTVKGEQWKERFPEERNVLLKRSTYSMRSDSRLLSCQQDSKRCFG